MTWLGLKKYNTKNNYCIEALPDPRGRSIRSFHTTSIFFSATVSTLQGTIVKKKIYVIFRVILYIPLFGK